MNKTITPITEVTSVEELQIMVTWLCGYLETMMLKVCDRAGASPEQREEVSAKSWEATAHIYALNAVAAAREREYKYALDQSVMVVVPSARDGFPVKYPEDWTVGTVIHRYISESLKKPCYVVELQETPQPVVYCDPDTIAPLPFPEFRKRGAPHE